jgi:hypothetical protein
MLNNVLLAIGIIILGVGLFVWNIKKDPKFNDIYGDRWRSIFVGIACVILGIFALCKILFFR